MANKYNDILTLVNAGNQMGLSNTIKRDYGIPLDFTSVQESYDAAVIYAAKSTLAYVGQTVAVGGKLYIITDVAADKYHAEDGQDYDNYLAEVGSKTEGDGNTIELDGQTLKLAGLTGLDGSKTYVPSLVNGKLVWAEPDTSTAEGQAQEINALKTRADELEATVNGVDASDGLVHKVAANAKAVEDEATARAAADTALEGKIAEALQAAKDYADTQDADTAYDDEEIRGLISANVSAIDGIDERVTDVETRVGELETAIDEVNTTIAGITHFTTQVVESTDAVTATGVLYLIKDDSVDGVDKYNEYLFIEGQGAVLIGDTTTDLSNYVTTEALNSAIAKFVTDDDITTAIAGKADQTYVDEALALKADIADVVTNETFEEFKTSNNTAIASARSNAVADVEAKGYAIEEEVQAKLDKKIETGTITHAITAVEADPEKGIEAVEGIPEGVTVEGTTLKIVVDAPTRAETVQLIADKVAQVTGGESAADVKLSLEAEVERSTAKDTAHDTALAKLQGTADVVGSVAEAKALAQTGVDNAAAALSAVNTLETGKVATNTSDITAVKGRLDTLETAKGDHEARISVVEGTITSLETTTANNAAAIGVLQGKDGELIAEDQRLAGLISTLQSNKANAVDVYTKDEINAQIADVRNAIPPTPDLSDYVKTEDLALKADANSVYTKDEADLAFMSQAEVDDRINALIIAADPEGGKTITDIQNLVKYVDENAAEIAGLVTATNANTDKLAGIDTTVKGYVDNALAAIVQPKASEEISVSSDGTLGIISINVNKLVQTAGDELILNGGAAI